MSEFSDRPPDPTPEQREAAYDSSVDGNAEPEFRAAQDLLPDLQGMSADGAQPPEPIAETPDVTDGKIEVPAGSDAEGTVDVAPASARDVLPDMPSTLSAEPASDAVQSAEDAAQVAGRGGAELTQAMYDHAVGAQGAGTGMADNIEFTADALPAIGKEVRDAGANVAKQLGDAGSEVGEAMGQAQADAGGTPIKDEIDAHLARIRGESELHSRRQ
jgi:hypothetical protein